MPRDLKVAVIKKFKKILVNLEWLVDLFPSLVDFFLASCLSLFPNK